MILGERLKQINSNIPDIWSVKTALYIGAYPKRFAFAEQLKSHSIATDVLEIDPKRCKALKRFKWIRKIINGDVTRVSEMGLGTYDLVLWSHGPSAITDKDLIYKTLSMLYDITGRVLVILCPWGRRAYTEDRLALRGSSDPMRFDLMLTALYEPDFLQLSFSVSTLGEKDGANSNLLAWKYAEEQDEMAQ